MSSVRPADLDTIRDLADLGENILGIARELGVKPESVKRRLRRHGEYALLDQIRTGNWQSQAHRRRTA